MPQTSDSRTLVHPSLSERVDILGVPVSATTLDRACAQILRWAKKREARSVCVADVHSVMRARTDPSHAAALAQADMVTPDGKPLSLLARLRGARGMGQVCGPELMPLVCSRSAGHGIRHYFYGGAPDVAEALAKKYRSQIEGIEIAGVECPPFRELSAAEKAETVERIRASGADIVWVGLGCPKQERWCAENVAALGGAVVIGVGAAFDFETGRVERAPKWMRQASLEWLHRLCSEPRRLWRRYLVLAPRFIALSIAESCVRWWSGLPLNGAHTTDATTALAPASARS